MPRGTVYLLHFDEPYKHARHYIGWSDNLDARIDAHRNGTGARLLEVIIGAGIGFCVARTWKRKTRAYERRLKKRGGAARICPLCRKEKATVLRARLKE